jgi:MFS family permease
MPGPTRVLWTFAITSIALFMAALDNLVVTTALPVIRATFDASLGELEWIVNAYTLTFAVLLLTGAALGDRFGRQRVFVIGLAIFTGGSVVAALSSTVEILIVARAIQGLGGAIITPLSLTILSAAVPPARRAVALGAWGGIAGLAIAIGPLVGGAIAEGLAWQAIFWVNVPIGLVAIPLAIFRLTETRGPSARLDLRGLGIVSAGLFAIVLGLIRGNELGWTSPEIVAALGLGTLLIAVFVLEARTGDPMLLLYLFRSRPSARQRRVVLMTSMPADFRHPVLPGRPALQPVPGRSARSWTISGFTPRRGSCHRDRHVPLLVVDGTSGDRAGWPSMVLTLTVEY